MRFFASLGSDALTKRFRVLHGLISHSIEGRLSSLTKGVFQREFLFLR